MNGQNCTIRFFAKKNSMGERRWFRFGIYIGAFCLAMVATMIVATTYRVFLGAPQVIAAPERPVLETPQKRSTLPPVDLNALTQNNLIYTADLGSSTYTPTERVELADASNYGERHAVDAYGQTVNNEYLAVLHETVWSANSAINTFQTYHPNDADQVSYHTIIDRDGTVIYIVPPEKRAFGAGNSVFEGANGPETVVTNPAFASSVNNFAYHISLVTPSDGQDNGSTHSGYTDAQYKSLAWLVARTTIPEERITTHAVVDRSGSRQDPRSFNWPHFLEYLHQYPSRAA